ARVLLVHHRGHTSHGLGHLVLRHDAVQQPVGNVLAGDAQRRTVFHQRDVVDVGHFGTAHALVDPAHDIAQDALGVVVDFLLALGGTPLGSRNHRDLQQAGQDVLALAVGVDL